MASEASKAASPGGGYLDEPDSEDEAPATTGTSEGSAVDIEAATEGAEALKTEGNAFFANKNYSEALQRYTAAINLLKHANAPKNPLLLLNRSATFIALKRYVPANYDAAQAAEIEPTNWKAHWRQGVALSSMTKKVPMMMLMLILMLMMMAYTVPYVYITYLPVPDLLLSFTFKIYSFIY